MVKLIFNPKKSGNNDVGVSKTSKKQDIAEVFSNLSLNPLKDTQSTFSEKNETNEQLSTKDLVGLENACFIINKWYLESLTDLKKNMLILIGPTGCGKTTLVELYCKENDIQMYSVKINDTIKTKKELLRELEIFIEYSSSTSFFIKDSQKYKKLILIDEYQNGQNDLLSTLDIIGLNELRSKGKLCPILIISGDPKGSKISDLKKNNETYYISEIPRESMKIWILKKYPTFTEKQITDIIKKCKSDKRIIINSLNFIKNTGQQDLNNYIESFYKDSDTNVYEFTEKLFDSTEQLENDEIFKVYDNDGFLLSWLVQENYLDYNDSIEAVANSAESISYAETIFSDTYESNRNFLPDTHCLHGLIIPRFHSKYPFKKNKCQLRTSCINNRYNIFLNNQKLFKKIRQSSNYTIDHFDTLFLKKFINQELIKSKKNNEHANGYLKNILKTFPETPIEITELIYKHFGEFKDPTGKEPKTKNFTLKFKEKLKQLL
jgi:GTPase SAR1 family protein